MRWDLFGVPDKQKYYCTIVVFLMIHGLSAIVSTQFIDYHGNHSSLGNHIILGRNLFKANKYRDNKNVIILIDYFYNTLMNS